MMVGKKKKTLANKLAKMSDDERARYMQHRADIEEEAKRRKEQLISTFMKKKIKKEEVFTRLNLAKINQNWHQIMRKSKCKQMREDVEHLKKWIEDQVNNKNDKIANLMKDLENAEEEYIRNFKSHSNHIDDILDNQNRYVEKLKKQYQNDLKQLLHSTERNELIIMENTEKEETYLRTVIFGQVKQAEGMIRKEYGDYMQKIYETECEFQTRLDHLQRTRGEVSGAIWRQIAATVESYVGRNDVRRAHLAELRRLDTESAATIAENEEIIRERELLIEDLQGEYLSIQSSQDTQLRYLQSEMTVLTNNLSKIRKHLRNDLRTDENQIRLLTDLSCKAEQHLDGLARKGQFILNLVETCEKFETEREKITRWMPMPNDYLTSPASPQDFVSGGSRKDSLKESSEMNQQSEQVSSEPTAPKPKERPQTTIPRTISSPSIPMGNPTPEPKKITAIEKIFLRTRTSEESSPPPSSSSTITEGVDDGGEEPVGLLERCFESLKCLEGFWFTFNRVQVNYLELREEKTVLLKENKQLKDTIRAALEAVAMSNSIPNNRFSSTVAHGRIAHSAPFRRIMVD